MNIVPNRKRVSFRGKKKAVIVSFIFYYSRIYLYYFGKHYYSIPTVSVY